MLVVEGWLLRKYEPIWKQKQIPKCFALMEYIFDL